MIQKLDGPGLASPVAAYGFAFAAVVAAGFIRWLLDPVLTDDLPFFAFYFATLFAAWYGGLGPGLASLVIGILSGVFFFCEPRYSFAASDVVRQLDILRFAGVGVAISLICEQLHQTRRRLETRRESLRTTLASIGDCVISTDTDARITYMNAVAESVTGWTLQEAVGQPLDTVFHIVNETTRRPVENPATRALREGVIVGLANHTVLIRKDETERPIDDSAAPIKDEHGHVLGCVLVFRDITERRRREQELSDEKARLESVVNHVISGIIVIDENGSVISINPAAERLFGYEADEVVGQNVKMLMPEPFHGEHDGYIANYRRTGDAKIIGIGREVVGLRKDGSTFPMDLAVSEFWHGKQRHFTGIVRDISERRRAEQQIYNLLIELRAADRQKDEFLAMLAHELRGPLAPLRNMLEIIKQAGDDGEMLAQARDTMERQLGQLVRLVDDLLDVSRITRNKLELREERVELASVVYQAAEVCRPLAERANHELKVTLPPQPIYLRGDTVRLTQVFANLLNNACKYTPPGGTIWVTAERQGSDVVVCIKDTGLGIPPDKLETIFEMFTQMDRSLERSQGGLGIGLTLVRRLVEMHGGRVEANSDGEGMGSAFMVRLPILIETPAVIVPESKPIAPAAARRILVVDDNWDSANSLAMLLKLSGNQTSTAYDGLEALEAAENFRPEVILLDIGLPKLNGLDVCRRIREWEWGKEMVIVALTGWGQDDDRRKSQDAGFNHHMVKPVDHAGLMNLLADAPSAIP